MKYDTFLVPFSTYQNLKKLGMTVKGCFQTITL